MARGEFVTPGQSEIERRLLEIRGAVHEASVLRYLKEQGLVVAEIAGSQPPADSLHLRSCGNRHSLDRSLGPALIGIIRKAPGSAVSARVHLGLDAAAAKRRALRPAAQTEGVMPSVPDIA